MIRFVTGTGIVFLFLAALVVADWLVNQLARVMP